MEIIYIIVIVVLWTSSLIFAFVFGKEKGFKAGGLYVLSEFRRDLDK